MCTSVLKAAPCCLGSLWNMAFFPVRNKRQADAIFAALATESASLLLAQEAHLAWADVQP